MDPNKERPQFLTKKAVKAINEAESKEDLLFTKPVFQIVSVKDVRQKK